MITLKAALAPALAVTAAGIAMMTAAPAVAQVNGIATSSPEGAIYQSQARQTAYNQIGQTYAAQFQQLDGIQREINTHRETLDTNDDGQISEAEAQANSAVADQLRTKQREANQVQAPILLAQLYVIDQLLRRYNEAQTNVITTKNIQVMLTPEAFQFAAPGTDVTQDIITQLNTLVPTVSTQPPEGFQPTEQVVAFYQTVQEIGIAQLIRQQQQQQAAAGGTTPAPQPAPAQPVGR